MEEVVDYKKLIIELVEKMKSSKNLKRMYRLATLLYTREADS